VEITIPAGAAATDVTATISQALNTNPVTGFQVAKTFEVGFESVATGQPITTFDAPYTLKLTYDPVKVAGVDVDLLKVYYWSDAVSAWVEVPSTLNTATNTFTVSLPHATTFAIMADVSTEARPTLAKVQAASLRGRMWLATGAAPSGATVQVVVNNVVQSTVTANPGGRWQAWLTLKQGANSVFAATTGATTRASAETYPTYLPLSLTDIAGHWAEQYVKDLVDRNVITGYEDDTFRTEDDITRAEFCTLIVKALGLEQDASGAEKFTDYTAIPEWARPFVGAAAKAGIVQGFDDNTFRADDKITRVEMATMISRSLALKAVTSSQGATKTFADDATIPEWAKGHVAKASGYGIVTGYEDSTFKPDNPASRAESATMVMRLLNVE
jgi:hypothetical protein